MGAGLLGLDKHKTSPPDKTRGASRCVCRANGNGQRMKHRAVIFILGCCAAGAGSGDQKDVFSDEPPLLRSSTSRACLWGLRKHDFKRTTKGALLLHSSIVLRLRGLNFESENTGFSGGLPPHWAAGSCSGADAAGNGKETHALRMTLLGY